MFHVYVLRSETTARHYVGYTSDLTHRLGQHNDGITKSTKNRGPWQLVHSEDFNTRPEAVRRERFLKTGQGRAELKRILILPGDPSGKSPPEAEIRLRRTGSSNLSGRTIFSIKTHVFENAAGCGVSRCTAGLPFAEGRAINSSQPEHISCENPQR
jgi:putative endonuclease